MYLVRTKIKDEFVGVSCMYPEKKQALSDLDTRYQQAKFEGKRPIVYGNNDHMFVVVDENKVHMMQTLVRQRQLQRA